MACVNFIVNKPLAGHDEDAPPVATEQMLIVCDGLGGGGQNTYVVDGEKHTSAYLGSRRISKVCKKFFKDRYEDLCENMQAPDLLMAELKATLTGDLNDYVAEHGLKNIVKGKSMQMLPSTLVAVVYRQQEDHTDALVISAGDSRAFVLTPKDGLQQISTDDVFEGVDAFDKSATMTNNIRQDGEFHLNYGYFSLPAQCILLVCSDGCFDYVPSPMELEFRLEYSITQCAKNGDILESETNSLGEHMGAVLVRYGLKDDCTMAGAMLGYTDPESMRLWYNERGAEVKKNYTGPYAELEKESVKRKSEYAAPFRDAEQKLTELRAKADEQLKKALLTAFLRDVMGKTSYSHGISELTDALRGFELYRKFVSDLETGEQEAKRTAEEKRREREAEETRLRQLFKEMRYAEFLRDLTEKLRNMIPFTEKRELAKEYGQIRSSVDAAAADYTEAEAAFARSFGAFRTVDLQERREMEEFASVADSFEEWRTAYGRLVRAKQELRKCEERLKEFYMKRDGEVENEFLDAMKKGFSAYRTHRLSHEFLTGYEKCERLRKEIDAYEPLDETKKAEKFQAYLEEHLPAFFAFVKEDPTLYELLFGETLGELTELERQCEELRRQLGEFDRMKRDLWLHYKETYELFHTGKGGVV